MTANNNQQLGSAAPSLLSTVWGTAWRFGAVFGAGIFALVYFGQRFLIFPAPTAVEQPQTPRDVPSSLVIKRDFAALYVPPQSETHPVVVFWHGNADQIGWGSAYFATQVHRKLKYGVFCIEYPGYGVLQKTLPQISAANAVASSREAVRHLTTTLNIHPSRLVFVGQSLGCAIALDLLTRLTADELPRSVILISPFASIPRMAEAIFPPRFVRPLLKALPFLVREKMDNLANAAIVRARFAQTGHKDQVLRVVHGTQDELVPFAHGKLVSQALGAELVSVKGATHNNMFDNRAMPFVLNAIVTSAL